MPAQLFGRHAKMHLQHLPHIHTGRHAQRIKHYLNGSAVRQEGHILFGKYAGNNALVAVAPRHLIPHGYFSLLSYINAHHAAYAGRKLVFILARESLDVHNHAALAVRHAQRGISYLAGFFPEYCAQQAFLGRHFRLSLGSDLAHENIPRTHLRSYADNSVFVQVGKAVLADIGDIPRDFLGAQLGIPRLAFVFFNMNGSENVVLDKRFAYKNSVLVVITFPGHKRYKYIAAQSYFALIRAGAVGNGLPF